MKAVDQINVYQTSSPNFLFSVSIRNVPVFYVVTVLANFVSLNVFYLSVLFLVINELKHAYVIRELFLSFAVFFL